MPVAKLERLMNLIAALLHTPTPLSAATLRERIAGYSQDPIAFHRQFARDKEDLREMGVPIRVETVLDSNPQVEGYRVDPDDYYLPDPDLEADELAALHLATRLVNIGRMPQSSGLLKLGGVAGPVDESVPPLAEIPIDANLAALFAAVGGTHRVHFAYRGSERTLLPQGLGFRHGRWYVSGWDLNSSEHRVYRLDRIEGAIRAGEPVEDVPGAPSHIGPLEPWLIGGDDPVTVQFVVDAAAAPGVTAQIGDDHVVGTDPEGRVVVELRVVNPEAFCTWILGFGASVEVVEPEPMRARIRERLQGLLDDGAPGDDR